MSVEDLAYVEDLVPPGVPEAPGNPDPPRYSKRTSAWSGLRVNPRPVEADVAWPALRATLRRRLVLRNTPVPPASPAHLIARQCDEPAFPWWNRAWRWIGGVMVHRINRQALFHQDLFAAERLKTHLRTIHH